MEVKGPNVLQLLRVFKSDKGSDLRIRDFGEANTDSPFYVELLANQIPNRENS